ncbi:hypothetical protein [uncultured Methylobacterium sp.]|uniref:hypothetical protein n=1 Tax=uncultured Methylobacterium sp. TaxID=157278 RepID=UPI0026310E5F|nr:hypothetical protein [uncultured Methylobacterium sp.]
MPEIPTVARLDPNHPAVASILALDIEAFRSGTNGPHDVHDHEAVAAALAPHVAAAPALREWSGDAAYSAAEVALSVAAEFVEGVAAPEEVNGWWLNQNKLNRLIDMQKSHREQMILERLGKFPGYVVFTDELWPDGTNIRIWPSHVSWDEAPPMLCLQADVTRREVEIAIRCWNKGWSRGQIDGGNRIREGIKSLLGIGED